jgi:acyl carrier protein
VEEVSVAADVRKYLRDELKVVGADTVGPEELLVDRGVLDSIELMQVAGFLERTYGIAVEDGEIVPDTLGSLAAIERFVERKRAPR